MAKKGGGLVVGKNRVFIGLGKGVFIVPRKSDLLMDLYR